MGHNVASKQKLLNEQKHAEEIAKENALKRSEEIRRNIQQANIEQANVINKEAGDVQKNMQGRFDQNLNTTLNAMAQNENISKKKATLFSSQKNLQANSQLVSKAQDIASRMRQTAADLKASGVSSGYQIGGNIGNAQRITDQRTNKMNYSAGMDVEQAKDYNANMGMQIGGQVLGAIGGVAGSFMSDEKTKTNKKKLSYEDMEKLFKNIQAYQYKYKKKYDLKIQKNVPQQKEHIGVMAQDVKKANPTAIDEVEHFEGNYSDKSKIEILKTLDRDEIMSMTIAGLSSVFEELQERDKEMELLKKEIENIKKEGKNGK